MGMLRRQYADLREGGFGSKAVLINPSRHLRNQVRNSIDSCRGAGDQPPLTQCATFTPEQMQQDVIQDFHPMPHVFPKRPGDVTWGEFLTAVGQRGRLFSRSRERRCQLIEKRRRGREPEEDHATGHSGIIGVAVVGTQVRAFQVRWKESAWLLSYARHRR
jgi:hypothetical protein